MANPTPFNPAWIKNGFHTDWTINQNIVCETAEFYRSDPDNEVSCDNKVVVGRLLSITSPRDGHYNGFKVNLYDTSKGKAQTTGDSKKVRFGNGAPYKYLLVFADQFDLPKCFALILTRKNDFPNFFDPQSLHTSLTIGDLVAVVEPRPNNKVLGENMTILSDPEFLVALDDTSSNWPQQNLITSRSSNNQVAFYKTGRTIEISMIRILIHNSKVGCLNYTCDRQSGHCLGCFGRSRTTGSIIVTANITVLNAPSYDTETSRAFFPAFRSLRFATLFFDNISSLSTQPPENVGPLRNTIRLRISAMVAHINTHGGWTVCGWHRRGISHNQSEDGDIVESTNTVGHLTYLQPSAPPVLISEDYKALLINTPAPQAPAPLNALPAAGAGASGNTSDS